MDLTVFFHPPENATDFENIQPIDIVNGNANITLVTISDIALETNEFFILRLNAQSFSSIQHIEEKGEFITDIASVNIIDDDCKYKIFLHL